MSAQDYYSQSNQQQGYSSGQAYSAPPQQQYGQPQYGGQQQQQYPQQQHYGPPPQQQYSSASPAPYQQPQYGAPGQDNRGPSPYQPQPQYGAPGPAPGAVGYDGQTDERGLGATLVGGAGAGWAAHHAGGGTLGTIAGAVAGAIGANVIEHFVEKKRDEKHHNQQGGYYGGQNGHHHHGRHHSGHHGGGGW
ncbi:MAG: hypothetical protein SEPTF4163_003179 [Sporothrix epigloea]